MAISKLKKIERLEESMEKMAKERKDLLAEYKKDLDKQKNRRICKRGSMIEEIQPETLKISDEQLKKVLQKVLKSKEICDWITEMQKELSYSPKPAPSKTELAKTEKSTADTSSKPEAKTDETDGDVDETVEPESDDDVSPYS